MSDFFRNTLPSDLEAIAAIASGALLEPVSGLAGIAGSILPGKRGQGVRWLEEVQNLAYEPDNPETLSQIASAIEVPLELYEKGTNWLGDKTMESTGNVTLASIAKTSPELIGAMLGLGALGKSSMKRAVNAPVDEGRRDFLRDAGVVAAGTALGSKMPGLLDVKAPATAVAKAATVSRNIPLPSGGILRTLTPNELRLSTFLKAFDDPTLGLIEAFRKGGGKAVQDIVDKEGLDTLDNIHWEMDDVDKDQVLGLIDDFDNEVPNNVQIDFGDDYQGVLNPEHVAFGDWVQNGNIDDNFGNLVNSFKFEHDTGFGAIYDPISGDLGVHNDIEFLQGPTMEYSTPNQANKIRVYKPGDKDL